MKNATALCASLLAAVLTSAASAPALADEAAPANFQLHFRYDKAELDTEAGQKVLLTRLEGAVRLMCAPDGPQIATASRMRVCVKRTMNTALSSINSKSLQATYARLGSRAG